MNNEDHRRPGFRENGAGRAGIPPGPGAAGLAAAVQRQRDRRREERRLFRKARRALPDRGRPFRRAGRHAAWSIMSPGFDGQHPRFAALRRGGAEVISEIEFAFRQIRGRFIAVSGSNGKSTTVSLIQHLLLRRRPPQPPGRKYRHAVDRRGRRPSPPTRWWCWSCRASSSRRSSASGPRWRCC